MQHKDKTHSNKKTQHEHEANEVDAEEDRKHNKNKTSGDNK